MTKSFESLEPTAVLVGSAFEQFPSGVLVEKPGDLSEPRRISPRKRAEEEMARNFGLAQAARAEAEALRKTSLALTQNLSMDYVLGTLLQALLKLCPVRVGASHSRGSRHAFFSRSGDAQLRTEFPGSLLTSDFRCTEQLFSDAGVVAT